VCQQRYILQSVEEHASDFFQAGDIHIWDRISAVLLRHIRAQDVGGDLTCLAWNPAAENPFMFAAGSHDGAVRIWSSPLPATNNQNEGSSSQLNTESPIQSHAQPHTDPFTQVFGGNYGIGNHAIEALSPLDSDVEYRRSESPAQLESDSHHTHSGASKGSSRERTVAFVAP
jgi:WD40 repeat protein